jgi:hypothetical protein
MANRITSFEEMFERYAGKHREELDNDTLMDLIERTFYAGASSGLGVIANRIANLEGSRDPSDVIRGISDVITKASTELYIINEKQNGQVGTG